MRKKIALTSSLLLATLANADISQSGFFVGIDFSNVDSNIKYSSNGLATSSYENHVGSNASFKLDRVSLKAGYQAYFTRVYARYSSFECEDASRGKYSINDAKIIEANFDYIPVLYVNKKEDWQVRAIFGVGAGYNSSRMTDKDKNYLLPTNQSAGARQNYMEYGYQIGLLGETSSWLSVEAAYRARYGNLQEFTDGSSNATFALETKEFYIGLNYRF